MATGSTDVCGAIDGICEPCGGRGWRMRPTDGRLVLCYRCHGTGRWTPREASLPRDTGARP